jgi:predicted MFS family arabinose efflux permease
MLKGRSMGVVGAVASLASVIGAPFGSAIGQAFGWRNGIVAFAAATAVGVLVVLTWYRSPGPGVAGRGPHALGGGPARPGEPGRSAFRTPVVWALALLVGLVGMGQFSATFFVPSAARAAFGLDAVSASLIISAGYTLGIFTNLLFGYLMDRFDKWKVLALLIALMIPASLAMTSDVLLLFRIGTALLLALGFTATNQVYGVAGDVLTGRETGNVIGVVSLGAGVCGYAGPQLLGALRDWTNGFDAGWYMVAGVAAFTLAEIYVLHRYSLAARAAAVSPA